MIKVIADGVSGILYSIDYKKKTATVEMDYEYLVEYPWDEVVICKWEEIMAKRHANEFLRTNTGRLAGSGMDYDDYSEEARLSKNTRKANPVYTEEYSEYIKELQNQPVKTYKLTKEEMDEYLKKLKKE